MKTSKLLLPKGFKCAGWVVLAVAVVLTALVKLMPEGSIPLSLNDYRALLGLSPVMLPEGTMAIGIFDPENSDIVSTLSYILFVVAGVFIGFSRNRQDDEYVEQLRFESLVLSIYINSALMILGMVFYWGISFLYVMFVSLFSVLYLFIICFYIRLLLSKRWSV